MHILLVEDDREAAAYLVKGLSDSGHRVALAEHGRDGLERATLESFDAMIVDRMLPGLDGLTIVAAMRAARNQTPVLVLSALGDVEDRVKGLRAGCDDYLSKPFAFVELLARLEALTRRGSAETRLVVGDLEVDLLSRTATRAGRSIDLLPR
jgi:two-component system OmpR family response regulator